MSQQTQNRWKQQFGTEKYSPQGFIDSLANRIWRVRGVLIDTIDSDRKSVTRNYLISLLEESKYWGSKAAIAEACEIVIKKAKVADDFTYKPVAELSIKNESTKQVFYNKYNAPCQKVTPANANELKLWHSYWGSLLADKNERFSLQQWIAHIATKPHKRTGIAILLHGVTTGTGKGTLGEVLTELVGQPNTTKPMNPVESLTGRFNGALEGKVLFMIDELYSGGSFKLSNGIKSKITEETLAVEPKGGELKTIDNYCNFYATSNHLTPLWLDSNDRRWEVYNVEFDDTDKEVRQTAVRNFRTWFEKDRKHAVAVIRFILQSVSLENYTPWVTGAKMTPAKQTLIENSISNNEEDFEVYWNQRVFNDNLMVNATDLFSEQWTKVSAGQRKEILVKLGCKRLLKTTNVSIGSIQSRNWWITPKGIKLGMKPSMNGGELGKLLESNRTDVTCLTYESDSDGLSVKTSTEF